MQNIKKMRERASLTQVELAKVLGVGQSTIAMWETGESAPRAALLPKIAELLKCSIDELFESDKSQEQEAVRPLFRANRGQA